MSALTRRPASADGPGRQHKHGTEAYGGQLHGECVEGPPQQVEDREAREKEAHQGRRTPGRRHVAPPIHETHVGGQREHEHVVPALRRQQRHQHEEVRAFQIVGFGHVLPPRHHEEPRDDGDDRRSQRETLRRRARPDPLRPHRGERDVLRREQVRCRRLGDGAIPLVQQGQVAVPAVGCGRQQQPARQHEAERYKRTPAERPGQPRHQDEGIRLDEHARGDEAPAANPPPRCAAITAPSRSSASGRLNFPNHELLDEKLASQQQCEPDERLR